MADTRTTFNMGSQQAELEIFKRITMTYERARKEPASTDESVFKTVIGELGELFGQSSDINMKDSLTVFQRVAGVYEGEKKKSKYTIQQGYSVVRAELKDLFAL
jgi:hypothetical protein